MQKIFIINGHQPYPFAPGRLNTTFVSQAQTYLEGCGYRVQTTEVAQGWDVETEINKHQWADVILMQFPINWMGTPWIFKKYMDEVYTAGMDGRLCAGDGRSGPEDGHLYGLGGTQSECRYMFSVTFNAPKDAFENPAAPFFEQRSVDDLLWPMHLNARFFGMKPLPTFSAHDVMKNPTIESDFQRFQAHLQAHFPALSQARTHR